MKEKCEIIQGKHIMEREKVIKGFIKDINKALKAMAKAYKENAFTYREYMEVLRFVSDETTLLFISTKQFCDKYKLQLK